MAEIIVEDGTGKTNANSYVDEAFANEYAASVGITLSGNLEVNLLKAAEYLDGFSSRFQGHKKSKAQSMQWPRNLVFENGSISVANTIVPVDIKKAQVQIAASLGDGVEVYEDIDRMQVKKEKVDVLETEYFENEAGEKILGYANRTLKKFFIENSGYRLTTRHGY